LAPWAKGAQNVSEKVGDFCNGYNELAFFVTGQIGMKFGKKRDKTSIGVLYWTLIEEF